MQFFILATAGKQCSHTVCKFNNINYMFKIKWYHFMTVFS